MENWYLVHTKPRQEKLALFNLERQGYECYLPTLRTEKLHREILKLVDEVLFPRYLFIRLGRGAAARSWSPIRSTKGVSKLVCFGDRPALVDDCLVFMLRSREMEQCQKPQSLFEFGEHVAINVGAFAGLEGVFEEMESDRRAMVLIEFLSRPVRVPVNPASLRKLA